MFPWLKRLMPRYLFGRFILILIIPMIILQGIVIYVFYERHWDSVSRHMAKGLAGDILYLTALLEHSDPSTYPDLLEGANHHLYLQASYTPQVELQQFTSEYSPGIERLKAFLLPLHHDVVIHYVDQGDIIAVEVGLAKGVLTVKASSKRIENRTTIIFILWMVGSGLILMMIALLFTRIQLRAISRLAMAAEQFGRGLEAGAFKPQGAEEVKKAARAFMRMKRRIKRQITTRMSMLSNISHDLKTPLTRMKLQLAMMPESEDITGLKQDVSDMEHMVQEYLDFVRGEGTETASLVDMEEFLISIHDKYKQTPLSLTIETQQSLMIRLHAMRRAITNIIDNALRYGTVVELHTLEHRRNFIILVDDNGPGIPLDKRNAVFHPFVRLDPARSQLSGGSVGLGLTIARDIIQSHGGRIHLHDSPLGGLRVEIVLPI